jgi:hypothetical protein
VSRMVCLYRLKEGTSTSGWNDFLREVDIPLTFQLPSVTAYSVSPIGEELGGTLGFHYLEVVDFTSRAALEEDMKGDLWAKGVQAMADNGMEREICFILEPEVK